MVVKTRTAAGRRSRVLSTVAVDDLVDNPHAYRVRQGWGKVGQKLVSQFDGVAFCDPIPFRPAAKGVAFRDPLQRWGGEKPPRCRSRGCAGRLLYRLTSASKKRIIPLLFRRLPT